MSKEKQRLINIGRATERFFETNDHVFDGNSWLMTNEEGDFEIHTVDELLDWFDDIQEEKISFRDRNDFIRNFQTVHTHLLILTQDIKYPLDEERQKWLDYAFRIVSHLINLEFQDDFNRALESEKNEG